MMHVQESRGQETENYVQEYNESSVAEDRPTHHPWRALLPLTLIAGGVVLVMSGWNVSDFRQWLNAAGSWAPLVFVFTAVAAMTLMVPKTAVSVTAGVLFGTALGSFLLLIVAVMAAALNYAIGRWWLYESIELKLAAAGQSNRSLLLRAVRDMASEAGLRFHLLVRLAPVPTTMISYAMGASGSRIGPFLLAAAITVIPQTLWVHGGTAVTLIGQPHSAPLQWIGPIISILAAITISVLIPPLALQRVEALRRRREAAGKRLNDLNPRGAAD